MVGKHAHIENRVFMVIRAKKSMIHLSEKLRIAAHLKPWVHTGDRVIKWRAAADAGLTWITLHLMIFELDIIFTDWPNFNTCSSKLVNGVCFRAHKYQKSLTSNIRCKQKVVIFTFWTGSGTLLDLSLVFTKSLFSLCSESDISRPVCNAPPKCYNSCWIDCSLGSLLISNDYSITIIASADKSLYSMIVVCANFCRST